jgi:hypothetical protein
MKLTPVAYRKIARASCFAACIGDFVVTLLLGLFHKHYDLLNQTESFLGTNDSPVSVYMNTWGIFFSLLFITFAYALYKAAFSKDFWQITAVWLIVIYGLGEGIGSGLFPYNHIGTELTLSGKLHNLFSGIGQIAMVVLPFVSLKIYPKHIAPRLNRFIRFETFTILLLMIVFIVARQDLIPLKGLWQRILILDYYLLLMVIAIKLP